jgi:hypothetical protein
MLSLLLDLHLLLNDRRRHGMIGASLLQIQRFLF